MHRHEFSYSQFWADTHTFQMEHSIPFHLFHFESPEIIRKSAGIARIPMHISFFYVPKHGTDWNGTNGMEWNFRFIPFFLPRPANLFFQNCRALVCSARFYCRSPRGGAPTLPAWSAAATPARSAAAMPARSAAATPYRALRALPK
jgi:hypothetical protein